MSRETRIDSLDDHGKFLFIYSDKYNIYFFFHRDDGKLFKIVTDKYMDVESVDEINCPTDFHHYEDVKFFKPYQKEPTDYTFIGIVTVNNLSYKFSINDDLLEFGESVVYTDVKALNGLSCMKDIDVTTHIQKKNKVFLIGIDTSDGGCEPVYGVIDLASDRFENIYYLYSDRGELQLETVNIDVDELRVYVGGGIQTDEGNTPFIETFLMKP